MNQITFHVPETDTPRRRMPPSERVTSYIRWHFEHYGQPASRDSIAFVLMKDGMSKASVIDLLSAMYERRQVLFVQQSAVRVDGVKLPTTDGFVLPEHLEAM